MPTMQTMMWPIPLSALVLASCCLLPFVAAHDNGMDMSMDGSMTLAQGHMLPYFHFTIGDNLWFLGWVPQSPGAMVGACLGLFLLGIMDRWIEACRAMMQAHWTKRAMIVQANRMNANAHCLPSNSSESEKGRSAGSSAATTTQHLMDTVRMRTVLPFVFWHDVMRGVLFAGHAALQFAFMLAIMTYQVGFIFAIIVGLGVGETLFGRFASHSSHIG